MKYIYGLNKSGEAIINYLDNIKENYYCWDDNISIRNKLSKKKIKINFQKPQNLNYKLINESFVTPGISLNDEKLQSLRNNEINLFRDLELYSRLTKDKKIIAITGTNGKSTTTKLISDLLLKSNIANFVGGNLGIPLLDFTKNNDLAKYHVVELSSFQLESSNTFSPFISILLNISPDHLDRYKNYEEYILQKEKIITFNNHGYNIVSLDHEENFKIYKKYKKKIIPISINYLDKGVYYQNNKIIDNYFDTKKDLDINLISSSLFGLFNIENILAAYVVSRLLNIDSKNFLDTIKNFKGLSHRLEKIYEDKNLQVINNSKASNLHAAIQSILNYDNISLILGGIAKENNFKKILLHREKIKKIYLIGESSLIIFSQLKDKINCEICGNLKIALEKIFQDINSSKDFETILFSPACASFDQFNNFNQRGDYFKKLIKEIFNE